MLSIEVSCYAREPLLVLMLMGGELAWVGFACELHRSLNSQRLQMHRRLDTIPPGYNTVRYKAGIRRSLVEKVKCCRCPPTLRVILLIPLLIQYRVTPTTEFVLNFSFRYFLNNKHIHLKVLIQLFYEVSPAWKYNTSSLYMLYSLTSGRLLLYSSFFLSPEASYFSEFVAIYNRHFFYSTSSL